MRTLALSRFIQTYNWQISTTSLLSISWVARVLFRDVSMIALIDVNSAVRHACVEAFSKINESVSVFYSAQTFVDSGAFYKTKLLVLGKTHPSRTHCCTFRWATSVRPYLKTFLLDSRRLEMRRLLDVCNDRSQHLVCDHHSCRIEACRNALAMGLFDPTIQAPSSIWAAQP